MLNIITAALALVSRATSVPTTNKTLCGPPPSLPVGRLEYAWRLLNLLKVFLVRLNWPPSSLVSDGLRASMSENESFIVAASYFSRGDFRRLGVPIWGVDLAGPNSPNHGHGERCRGKSFM